MVKKRYGSNQADNIKSVVNALGVQQSNATKAKAKVIASIEKAKPDTVNDEGRPAFALPVFDELVRMLQTEKVKDSFYQSKEDKFKRLAEMIDILGKYDPELLAKTIVYCRCNDDGLRTINQIAAVLAYPYLAGKDYARHFYGPFNRRLRCGGVVFRADDACKIMDFWRAGHKTYSATAKDHQGPASVPNAMKNGFKKVVEVADLYTLQTYKDSIIDVARLCHPDSSACATLIDPSTGKKVSALNYIMHDGVIVTKDSRRANSEAGQVIAEAEKSGKISSEQANELRNASKVANFVDEIESRKMGIHKALLSIRSILTTTDFPKETIEKFCEFISDKNIILKNMVMPIQFDTAYDLVCLEFEGHKYANLIKEALQNGYLNSIANLGKVLEGQRVAVILDYSSSVRGRAAIDDSYLKIFERKVESLKLSLLGGKLNGKIVSNRLYSGYNSKSASLPSSCETWYKASLIAATILQATGGDFIPFADRAAFATYDKNKNVFALAKELRETNYHVGGCTYLQRAFELMSRSKKVYDKIIVITDNDVNQGCGCDTPQECLADYMKSIPGITVPTFIVNDVCAYGTDAIRGNNVISVAGSGRILYKELTNLTSLPDGSELQKQYLDELVAKIKSIDLVYRKK